MKMANTVKSRVSFIFLLGALNLISGQIRYSIPEELEYGAFVGNIAEDLKLNIWELSARNFRLVSDDRNQYMEVNVENGILHVGERIDREHLCGQRSTCSISFQIALDNPPEMHRVAVEILDVNDNSPSFSKDVYSLRIIEFTAPGARYPLESAFDPDAGSNTISGYQISPNSHFGLKVQTRSDGGKMAGLLLEKPLDREEQSAFHLVLTAIDGGIPHRSGTAQIIISIMDANDNAPVFDHGIYRTNVLENAPEGTLVIKVNAVDLDEGTNAELTYSFTSHTLQMARELFRLDPGTGEIRVQGVLDFEQNNLHELHVEAVDKSYFAMTGHTKVLVGLIDVNDNIPEVEVTSVSSTIPEDAHAGTIIAAISVRDPDVGENGQIQCAIDVNIPFKLQKAQNDNFKLVSNDVLDCEMYPEYNISISCWDSGLPPLAAIKSILVSISDVNDNAPKFTQPSYNVLVMENNQPGAFLSAVIALDPDLGQNGAVTYSFLENKMQNVSTPPISINLESGSIYALLSFDYEQLKNFQTIVQAQDAGLPPLSSTAIVNVIILDQNDNAPVIISPLPCNSPASVQIGRQAIYPGDVVTKVIAIDADSGINTRLSFQILEASDSSLFSVGLLSGEISAVRRFNNQDATTQKVVIMVKDNGQPSLSSTTTICYSVLSNVPEKLAVQSREPSGPENFTELSIYLIIIFGSTSFIFLAIIIILAVLKCKQDRNINHYNPTCCCCRRRSNSNDAFHRRNFSKDMISYSGAQQPLPISATYQYSVRLPPDSSKSDFLFLKPCDATLPLNDLNAHTSSARKEEI
ncbi:protocadherin alpha-C2-like [Scyliorhinus torazame]|uniref:protocadherin alpha-C2-like n=1 Tax=Scyliorhinus torazame TaxID=75743 RepID=UPI003B59DBF7